MNLNFKFSASLLFSALFIWTLNGNAQERNFNKIRVGLSISPFAENNIGPFEELVGSGSFESEKFFGADLSVNVPIKGIFSIESGLGYSTQSVTFKGAFNPEHETFTETKNLSILEIPILGSVHFGNYFYVNLGPTLHFDLSKKVDYRDKQNGIGANLGIGANYNISPIFSVHLEPYLKSYSLIPFESGKYYDRITQLGFKIGGRITLD